MTNVTRPIFLQDSLWTRLRDLLRVHLGLNYSNERIGDLQRRIKDAAPAFGMASAEACADWLLSAPITQKQIEILAKYLTIGETYFFRDKASFRILEEQLLPNLLEQRKSSRHIRIWSAGCCTGEEPYSIAILLAKMIPQIDDWNITILATDIDTDFLKKGMQGIFGEWSFRGTQLQDRKTLFKKTETGHYELCEKIRKMVSFSYLNLAKDLFPSVETNTNAMDMIFCRNVLMYFEPSYALKVMQKLEQSLVEGGHLFLSPVEIPDNIVPQLAPIAFPEAIIYQKDSHYLLDKQRAAPLLPLYSREQIAAPKDVKQHHFEEAIEPDKTQLILKARAAALAEEQGFEILENTTALLIFKLGEELFALESEYIQEVYPLKEITPLPCTPAYVLGIINVRGQIVSMIDIKQFLGFPKKALTKSSKAIILYYESLAFGILADDIIGTQSIAINGIQKSLSSLTGIRAAYLRGITANRLVILDAKKLITDKKMVVYEQV